MTEMKHLYNDIDPPGFVDKNLTGNLPKGDTTYTSTPVKESKMKGKPTFRLSCCLVSLAVFIATIALIMATASFVLVLMQENQPACQGSENRPASSCQQILDCDSSSSSGYYWIASEDGNATQQYCSMNRVCGGLDGGWMRVAELDMRSDSSQCPSALTPHPDQRLCGISIGNGNCSQVFFEVNNVSYNQVCGKIIAYQFGSPDSFTGNKQIDTDYVDGISLTYGMNTRKHIWTFAAAIDEAKDNPGSKCPCTNIATASHATSPPAFVGNDYFCDTGSMERFTGTLYADNPLWDGAGCGPANFCCSLNNPPWFFKQLQSSTSEDIEMRVCMDELPVNEDVRIEQIMIYVH